MNTFAAVAWIVGFAALPLLVWIKPKWFQRLGTLAVHDTPEGKRVFVSASFLPAALIAVMLIFGILVWPTLYEYEHDQGRLVRIGRISETVQVLSAGKWVPAESVSRASQPRRANQILLKYGIDTLTDADRWESLVDRGIPEDSATALINSLRAVRSILGDTTGAPRN